MTNKRLRKCKEIKGNLEEVFSPLGFGLSAVLANIFLGCPDLSEIVFGISFGECSRCAHDGKCEIKGQNPEGINRTGEYNGRVTFC